MDATRKLTAVLMPTRNGRGYFVRVTNYGALVCERTFADYREANKFARLVRAGKSGL